MLSTPEPPQLNSPLVRRVQIAQAALDSFRGKPFAWGTNDCARLAAQVLEAAGYDPNMQQFGDYRSDRQALRALKNRGFTTVSDWLDSVKGLIRIAPAATLPGDLIAFPGEGGWEGITVVLGGGRVLAFTEQVADGACHILDANMWAALAAWKVHPWPKS